MDNDSADLLRILSPLELRLQTFYPFWETSSVTVRNSMGLIFRLYSGSAELALLGSYQFVLRGGDSVTSDLAVPEVERSRSADL